MRPVSATRQIPFAGLRVLFLVFSCAFGVSGCIEGASFRGGVDTSGADADTLQLEDTLGADAFGTDARAPDADSAGGMDATHADVDWRDVLPEVSDASRADAGELDAADTADIIDTADSRDVSEDVNEDIGEPVVPFPCQSDAECAVALGDAPGPCFVAACHPRGRYCFWRALPNGSEVAPPDACALAAYCAFGEVRPAVLRDCDDGNPCTEDSCDSQEGCLHAPLSDVPCDDANACSSAGTCLTGVCVSETNICPCESAADCAPYDDDNPCNGSLTCDGGICVVAPESVVRCPASEEPGCTQLVCDPASGACAPTPKPDGSLCLDDDICTAGDTCEAGACVPGGPLDCDDGNACTTDACDGERGCTWTPRSDGDCNDGDVCTAGDTCQEGLCRGERRAACACATDGDCAEHQDEDLCNGELVCADGFCSTEPATVIVCDAAESACDGEDGDGESGDCGCLQMACEPSSGACEPQVLPDGGFCRDDDPCTLAERCEDGGCEPGLWLGCDDGNDCTDDHCEPGVGCVHDPNDAVCDDGVACTHSDSCAAGACAGQPYDCDDGTACTEVRCLGDGTCSPPILLDGYCDIEGFGCVEGATPHPDDPCLRCDPTSSPRAWSPVDDGASCDDGDACTVDDACGGGACSGVARTCDDENACTTDTCEPTTGCVHEAVDCHDGVSCTEDACDTVTGCVHVPDDAACDDSEDCTRDLCDLEQGCVFESDPRDGVACNDGNACTVGTTCSAGLCGGGSDVELDDGNECTDDACAPESGVTHTPRTGEACIANDGPCPLPGTCELLDGAPRCVGVPVDCDDEDPCTDDLCDPGTPGGCLHEWNTATCDDGDPCTVGDVCAEGACVAGNDELDCNDGVDCTVDTCTPGEGCSHAPDDGSCDDENPCTVDTCDADEGCEHSPEPDGDACETDYACVAGECVWTGACGNVLCPPMAGYTAECNDQGHCEYASDDVSGWRAHGAWIWVPPGAFAMGAPSAEMDSSSVERPVHTVTFAEGYFIERNELTAASYEACEAAGACTPPSTVDWDGEGWGTNRSANGRGEHPQNGLRWQQAADVCAWLGGRLPTEAEWEYAAKGPSHHRYPWGDDPEPTCANDTALFNEAGTVEGYACGTGGTEPIGGRNGGAAWSGALGMAGSVREWTEDCFHLSYSDAPVDGSAWTSDGCQGTVRVTRGGSLADSAQSLRVARRDGADPDDRRFDLGVRCVRDVSPVGVYCNVPCPALAGYDATCNAQNHCEYIRSNSTEDWHAYDVWIWVPPGRFDMGAAGVAEPVHTVTFAEGYFFGKFEIEVTAYEACEMAGECSAPSTLDVDDGWGTNRSSSGRGTHPQNGLTWNQARTFCFWSGGRLASEAEWEYAAKGPVQRIYPWGDTPLPTCENHTAVFNEQGGEEGYGCGSGGTWPVGSMVAGVAWCGAYDMLGNVMEWVEDWWHPDYTGAPTDGSAWLEPVWSSPVVRGEGFISHGDLLGASQRTYGGPSQRVAHFGGRCARSADCAPGESDTPGGCAIADADCAGHADGVFCDDGDPCTDGDACESGVCVPGLPVDCDDGVDCTSDSCDPTTGCQHEPLDLTCDDGNPCTTDSCDAALGCLNVPLEDGQGCGADLACIDGACEWMGTCGGDPCPVLPGYTVTCNPHGRCEYASESQADGGQWDVWLYVPPGEFEMGGPAEEGGADSERPTHSVTFYEGFFIAKHEIVVALYEACEADAECSPPSVDSWDGSGWGLNRTASGREAHPQNGLAWQQAKDFCAWAAPGGRLPSESEWEYAAKGTSHRTYPWGSAPAPSCEGELAVFLEQLPIPNGYGCGTGGTWPAGAMANGASPFGALDMGGNLSEWVEDCWHTSYAGAPADGSAWVADCDDSGRVRRGGSFHDGPETLRTAIRGGWVADVQHAGTGARCVRDLSPVGVYCNVPCPALAGHEVTCNTQNHCEYTRAEPSASWHADDVWLWVPPGTFSMGSPDGEGEDAERPLHDVSFSRGYFVAKHETTADAYAAFLDDQGSPGCSYRDGAWDCLGTGIGSVGWTGSEAQVRATCQAAAGGAADQGCARHPATPVTWYGAGAFCAWNGGRLCSEAEWERAAKGTQHRLYPWGDDAPDATRANCHFDTCGDGFAEAAPIGSFADGASPVGCLDVAGNVMEWVEDDWHDDYTNAPLDGSAWIDPPGPSRDRIRRGGVWVSPAAGLRAAHRAPASPQGGSDQVGFRCCRSAPCAEGETATEDGCAIPGEDCAGHADGTGCGLERFCVEDGVCSGSVCVAGTWPCAPERCDEALDACAPLEWGWTTITTSSGSARVVLGPDDVAHACYGDVTTGALRYATNASGRWVATHVDDAADVVSCAIAIDTTGSAHIAYGDRANWVTRYSDLQYATNAGGGWATTFVRDGDRKEGQSPSIAIAADGTVHIASVDGSNYDLEYSVRATDGQWSLESPDQDNYPETTAIGVAPDGTVHIVYAKHTPTLVRHISRSPGGTWEQSAVDTWSGGGGVTYRSPAVALDAEGALHVAYGFSGVPGGVRYRTNRGGSWQGVTIRDEPEAANSAAIALDESGHAHVSFVDWSSPSVAYATNASGAWDWVLVETLPLEGGSPPTSIAVTAGGEIVVSYGVGQDSVMAVAPR